MNFNSNETRTDPFLVNVPGVKAFEWTKWNTKADREVLLESVAQCGNFYWFGHGNAKGIGREFSSDGLLGNAEIANTIKNSVLGEWKPKRTYRLVILDCCHAYERDWTRALGYSFNGVNPMDEHGSTDTTSMYLSQLKKDPQAFIAWTCDRTVPSAGEALVPIYPSGFTVRQDAQQALFSEWQKGVPIKKCIQDFVSILKSYPVYNNSHKNGDPSKCDEDMWRIAGCADLDNTFR
jgi:hypothetical protein